MANTGPPEILLGQDNAAFWFSNTSSSFWKDNNNVVLVSNDEEEDASSMSTRRSTVSDDEEILVQAFGEFSVGAQSVNDGAGAHWDISSCNATINSDTEMAVEQSFLLDDQVQEVEEGIASLSPNGVLTLTTPQRPVDRTHCLPIYAQMPPSYLLDAASRVTLHVPGVSPQDVRVSYDSLEAELRVSASRPLGPVRTFHKSIPADPLKYNLDGIQCYLHRGELLILLPHSCCTSTPNATTSTSCLDIIEPDYL